MLSTPPKDARRRVPVHPPLHGSPNGDEDAYPLADGRPSRLGCFGKGLEHDEQGAVVPEAYGSLRRALATRRSDHFAAIRLGGGGRRLAAPWATAARTSTEPAPADPEVPDPPRLDSREEAADLVELLWMALLRDVPFSRFGAGGALVTAAVDDLGRLSAPPAFGRAAHPDAGTLFRGLTAGDASGPFVSQLLLLQAAPGSPVGPARRRTAVAGLDHATSWDAYLALQRGADPREAMAWDAVRRLPRTPRDLAACARDDLPPQTAFLDAALVLLELGIRPADGSADGHGREGRSGWAGFGGTRLLDLIGEAAGRALRAAWRQKWYVHRRTRPEAVGGLLHRALSAVEAGRDARLPLHRDLLDATAPRLVRERHGSFLLPLAWPEGSPLHPAYPSAHAAVAGACATVLKAWFAAEARWPDPVEPDADGLAAVPVAGAQLTVAGEIDKLAANVAAGRAMAGVSRRSDVHGGLRLGEQVAVAVLGNRAADGPAAVPFRFTSFDGRPVSVAGAVGDDRR
jgi:hypothetical protein